MFFNDENSCFLDSGVKTKVAKIITLIDVPI